VCRSCLFVGKTLRYYTSTSCLKYKNNENPFSNDGFYLIWFVLRDFTLLHWIFKKQVIFAFKCLVLPTSVVPFSKFKKSTKHDVLNLRTFNASVTMSNLNFSEEIKILKDYTCFWLKNYIIEIHMQSTISRIYDSLNISPRNTCSTV